MSKLRNDPRKQRWVSNMDEFGRAGRANRLFRYAFRPVLHIMADRYISGRLSKEMMQVLQAELRLPPLILMPIG